MSNILVLVQNYPNNNGGVSLMYVHTRNKHYKMAGIKTTVLNFSAKENYTYEGISVITYKEYTKNKEKYKLLIAHAPNIKNHYRFIKKNHYLFNNVVLFFHGHEVLDINKEYPKPYNFVKNKKIKNFIRKYYDKYKFKLWKKFVPMIIDKTEFVFVSEWMYSKFQEYITIIPESNKHIIYNSVGNVFEASKINDKISKDYDFITVRSNIDDSKYAIDIVVNIASKLLNYNFLIIGRGNYFKYNQIPSNVKHINSAMKHKELMEYFDKSKIALMPSRTDAQGVMSCEMLTYGLPLITSDIFVFKEIFKNLNGIGFINNNHPTNKIEDIIEEVLSHEVKINKFNSKNTLEKEIRLISKLLKEF